MPRAPACLNFRHGPLAENPDGMYCESASPPKTAMASDRSLSHQRGFALVPVLWIAGLLAVLAASFSLSVRTTLRTTANILESGKAEAFADAGVALAVLDLTRSRQARTEQPRFPPNGATIFCELSENARLLISVNDQSGKIDINAAGLPLLQALISGLGEPPDRAAQLADAIFDFRDPDDDRRANGAEFAEYRSAGLGWGPKNGPLQAVEELGQVLGMTSDLLSRMKPHIGVHSGLPGFDPAAASGELIGVVRAGLEASAGSFGSFPEFARAVSLPAMFISASQQRFYTIRSQAVTPSGAVFAREAIVDLGPRQRPAHVFLRWARSPSLQQPRHGAAPFPGC
jgi:general secretion pathway protein K